MTDKRKPSGAGGGLSERRHARGARRLYSEKRPKCPSRRDGHGLDAIICALILSGERLTARQERFYWEHSDLIAAELRYLDGYIVHPDVAGGDR